MTSRNKKVIKNFQIIENTIKAEASKPLQMETESGKKMKLQCKN